MVSVEATERGKCSVDDLIVGMDGNHAIRKLSWAGVYLAMASGKHHVPLAVHVNSTGEARSLHRAVPCKAA